MRRMNLCLWKGIVKCTRCFLSDCEELLVKQVCMDLEELCTSVVDELCFRNHGIKESCCES